jgi:hypothetical protein
MKSYRVVGKASSLKDPLYFKGALINAHMLTFATKIFDQASSGGLKKLWESLVGYSKREVSVAEGYLYVMERRKEGLYLQ